jgi:hypothetical protein
VVELEPFGHGFGDESVVPLQVDYVRLRNGIGHEKIPQAGLSRARIPAALFSCSARVAADGNPIRLDRQK